MNCEVRVIVSISLAKCGDNIEVLLSVDWETEKLSKSTISLDDVFWKYTYIFTSTFGFYIAGARFSSSWISVNTGDTRLVKLGQSSLAK